MLSKNSYYVIVKFNSGEQVMAVLNDDTPQYIELLYPMTIKMIPYIVEGKAHEKITASPFCQFSDDKYYQIPKSSVMFVKKLHETLVPHFLSLLDETNVEFVPSKQQEERKLLWDDEDEDQMYSGEEDLSNLTAEEIEHRVSMLEDILSGLDKVINEEEPEKRFFIEGNDTVN